jgi:hypothetical protein
MTAATQALAQLARIGGTVRRQGDRLIVRAGPVPVPGELVERLRAAKPEIMAALAKAPTPPQQTPPAPERAGWDAADWRAFYDERAAIREHDGKRPRVEAERLAWGETLVEWHKANASPPPAWQCAGCLRPIGGAPAMTLPDAARVHDVAGYACLIAYGKRWRATAAKGLVGMGIEPPDRLAPRTQQ